MKKIILSTAFLITGLFVKSQVTSSTPTITSEVCPNVNITFAVTIIGTPTSVNPKALNQLPTVVSGI